MNRRLDPSAFSRDFSSRILTESDIPAILSLIKTNPQYEKACGVSASEVSIREDLTLLPPGKTAADKFFLGFFDTVVIKLKRRQNKIALLVQTFDLR